MKNLTAINHFETPAGGNDGPFCHNILPRVGVTLKKKQCNNVPPRVCVTLKKDFTDMIGIKIRKQHDMIFGCQQLTSTKTALM